MQITLTLNDKKLTADVAPDTLLIDFVRSHGCLSVKRGCETSNCGLCTVFLDDKPVLSCSVLAARADGHKVTTLEGLQDEAAEFGAFIADQGVPDKKDYHAEKYGKPALYTRNQFKQDLKEIIMEKRPEIIFTTAEYDRHGDHSGLVLFIKEILTEEKEYHPTLFSGVVHSNAGDENWPNRSAKRDNIWDYEREGIY